MADREDIATRHGIPHLADQLVGQTGAELEADAAVKASLLRMLSPRAAEVNAGEIAALELLNQKAKRARQAFGIEEDDEEGR